MDLSYAPLQSSRMWRLTVEIVTLSLVFSIGTSARTRSPRSRAFVDNDYVSALAAANRFLQAWQSHDQETAILLLTNAAKQLANVNRILHLPV